MEANMCDGRLVQTGLASAIAAIDSLLKSQRLIGWDYPETIRFTIRYYPQEHIYSVCVLTPRIDHRGWKSLQGRELE